MINKNHKPKLASTKLLFCVLIVSNSFCGYSAPLITSVTQNKSTVAKYEKFELQIDLSIRFFNPYDPDIIDMYTEFTSPSGKKYKAIGFYFQDYTRSTTDPNGSPYPIEKLTKSNSFDWRVRFAPNETGTWTYKVFVTTANGTETFPSNGSSSFYCTYSNNPGFIRKRDSRYLEYDNGELYFPIGLNYPSYESPGWRVNGGNTYGTYFFDDKYELFENNGVNYFRMFADHVTALSLYGYDFQEKHMYYDNEMNLKDAWQLDYIVSEAEKKGIYIQMCLFDYENLSDDSFTWGLWSGHGCNDGDNNCSIDDNNSPCGNSNNQDRCCDWNYLYNPFNSDFGGDLNHPKDFFNLSITNSIRIQKNIIRYFIARWGYSTNVLSWELFNEAEQFAGFTFNHQYYNCSEFADNTTLNNIKDWHLFIKNYIDTIDEFDHLITTSYAGGPNYFNDVMRNMDYMQIHRYTDIINPIYRNMDFQSDFYDKVINYSGNNVPILVGETGDACQSYFSVNNNNYLMDPNGFEVHNNTWATTFSGYLGIPSMWNRKYMENEDLFEIYFSISEFISKIGNISDEFTSIRKSQNGLRGYYLQSGDFVTGWLQDENYKTNNLISDYSNPLNNRYLYYLEEASRPKASSSNNQFTINNTNWGYYNINWYSTVDNNQLIHTEKAFSNGSLIINMPTSLRNSSVYGDAAFIAEFDCNTNYWNWSGLNGAAGHNVSGYLAVSSEGKVFYRTTDNKINCIYYSNNNWTWSNLNGASGYNVLGDLAINSSNQVFYRTTDNSINCIYYSNGSWQWSSLNGAAGHNVAGDIVINSSNQIFYKTTDNSINCIYYSNGSWRWSGLNGAAGNNVVGELAINSANQIFYKTANNSINCIYYSSGIWKWSGLNGAAGQNVSGYLTTIDGKVFYKTNSNSINCIYYSNGVWNWSGLNNVANGITSGYLVGGKDKVFFKSTDNSIKAIYWSGIWKLDDLHKAAGHNVGGDIALNSSNSNVFYKTYGSDRSLNAIYWTNSCSSSGLKSATTSKSTFEEFSDLNEPVENSVSESLNIVKMYPNPSSDVVEILKVHGKIKVFNSYGVLVFEGETSSEQFTFSVDGWSKGLYIVEVSKLNGEKQNIQLIVN